MTEHPAPGQRPRSTPPLALAQAIENVLRQAGHTDVAVIESFAVVVETVADDGERNLQVVSGTPLGGRVPVHRLDGMMAHGHRLVVRGQGAID